MQLTQTAHLVSVESYRTISEIRSSFGEYLFGTAFLVGIFLVLMLTGGMGGLGVSNARATGGSVFVLWSLLLGTTTSVPREVLTDISSGAISRVFLAAPGFRSILAARFLVNLFHALIVCGLMAIAFAAAGSVQFQAIPEKVLLTASFLGQSFGITLAFVAFAIATKSERTTQTVMFCSVFPLMLFPTEKFIGQFSAFVPLANLVAPIRNPAGSTGGLAATLLVASTLAVLALGIAAFEIVTRSQRRTGRILHV